MALQTYLAVDLGAGSGRVVAGLYDGKSIRIEDVNRFANTGVRLPTGWHWNITQLFANIRDGLALAGKTYGDSIRSVSVDTWGVDYGLVDQKGRLAGLPWMYRDNRTDGMMAAVGAKVPNEEIYRRTGIQFMFFNTIFQLAAEARDYHEAMENASRLLFVPDLLTYWLCGNQITERTIASTSQLLKVGSNEWDLDLAAALDIPTHLLRELTEPGTDVGSLLPSVREETGCGAMRVVACGSHDTASAVAGAPARTAQPLFISSGTWSLLGRELRRPLATDATFNAGFSNEQGLAGTTRFLKNVAGMWLLQECKRNWDAQGSTLGYGDLVHAAHTSKADALLNPDDVSFEKPCDMPAMIAEFFKRTNQPVVTELGDVTRVILQSLALRYRQLIQQMRSWMPDLPDTLHIVGGGAQNKLLNQWTADATGLRVEAGPIEATAAGNILAQLLAEKEISSVEEGRALIRSSFEPEIFEPQESSAWAEKEARFAALQSA